MIQVKTQWNKRRQRIVCHTLPVSSYIYCDFQFEKTS